jgi:hypothetical protein
MLTVKKPFGFGGIDQVAEFFGIPKKEVRHRAVTGRWPSYVIAGQRVFNIDELVEMLVENDSAEIPSESEEETTV